MQAVCEGKALSFPDEEVKILALWDELDAFKCALYIPMDTMCSRHSYAC